jgi:sulfoxide reductase heme-binding subunit YedZ
MTKAYPIRSAKTRRLQRRLVRHYLPLAALSGLAMIVVDQVLRPHEDKLGRLVIASAYAALLLIGATLLIGPLNLLRRRPNPVSSDLRRDVGIWAGLVSITHMLCGLQWHYPWEPWKFFWDGNGANPLRLDSFGQASFLGLGGILIVALLLAISSDRAFRNLGRQRWKALQRLNYVLLGLITLHAIIFIPTDERDQRYLLLVAGIVSVVIVGQIAGVAQRRRAQARPEHSQIGPVVINGRGDPEELL